MKSDAHHSSWQPTASLEMLHHRAQLLTKIRAYFEQTNALEVETPACSSYATTDLAIESFQLSYTGPGFPASHPLYLHTSPEFPMKRLLAAGSGAIYQICKVFRNGESGRQHNPEFTLLEWYRPHYDHHQLMADVATLVNSVLPAPREVEYLSYGEVFKRHLDIDPHQATRHQLQQCAKQHNIADTGRLELSSNDAWLDLLLTHCIEPHLGIKRLSFLYDYPATQASLAKIRPGPPPLAERFELYMEGMELANGFNELTNANQQQQRFNQDIERRDLHNQARVPMDKNLLAALNSGLPNCAGVALGIDRLLMQITHATHINQTLAFPINRA
ncbi:EF-P lysine aminoacylase EpmA [Pseudomonadota bacterium]